MVKLPEKQNGKVPRWALEKYEGAEEDFTDWLYGIIFWHMYKEADDFSEAEKIKADAFVRSEQLVRTMDITSTVERSLAWQWLHANEKAWYRFLPAEYETVEELMSHIMDSTDKMASNGKRISSMWSDIRFYVEDFIPWAKSQGVDASKLMKLPELWDAARSAVPYLRRILNNDEVTDGDRVTDVVDILDKLAKAGSAAKFREEMSDEKYRKSELPQLEGSMYIMHDFTRIVIDAPDELYVAVIQRKLDRLISEWHTGTAMDYQRGRRDRVNTSVT